jgi:hypothetical protein
MGFHLTSQERLGSGLFQASLPAADTAKIPAEASGKGAIETPKVDQAVVESKPTKEPLQPIIS